MSDWIRVEDGLPEIKERGSKNNPYSNDVLAYADGKIFVACRWICGKHEHFRGHDPEVYEDITHWMPLPKHPIKLTTTVPTLKEKD